MKRPQLVSQGTLNRLLNSADDARNRQDFQECVVILERASRLDPANAQILLNLGQAHGMNFDYAAAERSFERAIRVAPKKRKPWRPPRPGRSASKTTTWPPIITGGRPSKKTFRPTPSRRWRTFLSGSAGGKTLRN